MNKYFKQYKWSNIFSMLKNQKKEPKLCSSSAKNKLIVITGATSGIGLEAAKTFARQGASILSINRNEEKSKQLCSDIMSEYNVTCDYLLADFTHLKDIHNVGKQLLSLNQDIDVFIHNAGTYVTKKAFTEDNLEQVFQTNYLSTFILNYYVKDKFIAQNHGRILFVNSEAHRFAMWGLHLDDLRWEKHRYSGIKGYGFAKMAQLLSMISFNQYFENTNVTINAMHPGNIKTNSGSTNGKIYKFFKRIFVDRTAKPISTATDSIYYLSMSDEIQNISGKFFNLTTIEDPAPPALDKVEAEKLWNISLTLGGFHE